MGVVSVGVSLLLIYLRGYLIPGTPTLTKRYMPASVLQLFGKEPEPEIPNGLAATDTSSSNGSDTTTAPMSNEETQNESEGENKEPVTLSPEEYFPSVGVVEECDEKDDLCIEESFESEWMEEINALNNEDLSVEDAAAALGLDLGNHEFTMREDGQTRQLKRGQQTIGEWPSEAALIADIAASRVLESWDMSWNEYNLIEKGKLLNGLRVFLDTCPTSDGEIVFTEETVESCCSSHEVIAGVCEDTDERIFEHRIS